MVKQSAYKNVTENNFYAHSTNLENKSDWQLLKDHLENVGKLAEGFAGAFNCVEYGKTAGLLHDLGKYTVEFQKRLEGKHPKVDHATWGAKIALEKYKNNRCGYLIAYAIAGHHAGLANGEYRDDQKLTPLTQRCDNPTLPALNSVWKNEIEQQLPQELPIPPLKPKKGFGCFQQAFLSRMILSCLVDADRLDTEKSYEQAEGLPLSPRGQYPGLTQLKANFDQSILSFKGDKDINRKRANILAAVRHNAIIREPGLFSLTVPTGGGKTLASMAFALDHAEKYNKRRIIYVIPFTSIIEQNAAVFRKQFGEEYQHAVIEHHSAFNDPEIKHPDCKTKLKMAMENWDAPIIVTTVVQFMESLFSNRPTDCRKLHRVAGSVVILDEAQTLPMPLLRPCMAALDELAKNYACSVVLCTATQPAFKQEDGFEGGLQNVRELALSDSINPQQLYEQFQRVSVKHIGELDDAEIISRLRNEPQILCIVNTRKQARLLYQGIKDLDGSFHLSTCMCAVHRKSALEEIRAALLEGKKTGKPCRVVSTSLIEAGVDVDFPCVMRSDAGLDSIAQAAGRCNREGEGKAHESFVWIFTAKDHAPPHELKTYAAKMNETLGIPEFNKDPLGLAAIKNYFSKVYWHHEIGQDSQLDKYGILNTLKESKPQNLPFDWIAQNFKIINDTMTTVIVPYDAAAIDFIEQLKNLPDYLSVGQLARSLQVYTISVPKHWIGDLIKLGAMQYVQPKRFGEQFLVLESDNLYDKKNIGFNPDVDPLIMSGKDCNW